MKTTIKTLIEKITPLETDSDQPLTKAYWKHAANHFPKLLEALEDIASENPNEISDRDELIRCANIARQALTQAREVKL